MRVPKSIEKFSIEVVPSLLIEFGDQFHCRLASR